MVFINFSSVSMETILTLLPSSVYYTVSQSSVSVNEVLFSFLSLIFIRVNKWTLMEEGFTGPILWWFLMKVEVDYLYFTPLQRSWKTTSEHTVIQMFSSVDNITWIRTEQRKTVPLSQIIVNNINMTKKLIKTENNWKNLQAYQYSAIINTFLKNLSTFF